MPEIHPEHYTIMKKIFYELFLFVYIICHIAIRSFFIFNIVQPLGLLFVQRFPLNSCSLF